jgi:uncharacterized protein YhjY with autotransporter beta-barrel domain
MLFVLCTLCMVFGMRSAHALNPGNPTAGATLYNGPASATNPDCAGCHGAPPNAANTTGISAASNSSTLIYDAANTPGVNGPGGTGNSCTGGMCTDPGVEASIAPIGMAQNRLDVAAYIGQWATPVIATSPVNLGNPTPVAYNTPLAINVANYVSGGFTGGTVSEANLIAGGTPSYITVTPSAHSAITYGGSGTAFTYTPDTTLYNTTDTVTYTVTSANGGTSTSGTINITIGPPPAPTPQNQTIATAVAYQTTTTLTLDNTKITGISTGISLPTTTTTLGGTIAAAGGYNVTYTPPNGTYSAVNGNDTFTYKAVGPGGTSTTTATVTVTIANPNPGPHAYTATVAFNSGAPIQSSPINITNAFTNPGQANSYVLDTTGIKGTATLSGTTVTYTPPATQSGAGLDQFKVEAVSAGLTSAAATVTVNVAPPGPPVLGGVTSLSINGSYNTGAISTPPVNVASYFTGYITGFTITPGGGNKGTATIDASGNLTYTGPVNATTTDTFAVRATNSGGTQSSVAALAVTVTVPTPGTPTAGLDTVSVPYNTATPINLASVITGVLDPTTPVILAQAPKYGTATVAGTTVTYTGNVGYYGKQDSFTYKAHGPGGTSPAATVTLNVGLPPAPGAAASTLAAIYQVPATIDLTSSVSGIATGVAVDTQPAHGTAVASGYRITYTPAAGFLGADSFTYSSVGPGGNSAPSTITVKVTALPTTAPTVNMMVGLNSPSTLNLANFITGSGITGVEILTQPAHGSVTVNGTQVTYTPVPNFFGKDTFTYRAFGVAGQATGTVVVTVFGRPDPSQDADVNGLIDAQDAQARRFTRVQIDNFQERMNSLHHAPPPVDETPPATASRAPSQAQALGSVSVAGAGITTSPGAPLGNGLVPALAAAGNPRPQPAGPVVDPFADSPSAAMPDPALDTPSGQYRLMLPASGAIVAGGAGGGAGPSGAGLAGGMAMTNLASLDLASVVNGVTKGLDAGSGIGFWATGALNFGNREQPNALSDGLKFHTDGLSLGADRRVSDNLVLGLGVGYAYDRTFVGTDGTQSQASGTVLAAYASYQPTPSIYIDSVIGAGNLSFDSVRFVAPIDAVASGHRSGQQAFASVTAGYQFQEAGFQWSPYGRIDLATDRLHAYTETGAQNYALTYGAQSVPTEELALGVRADLVHETSFGSVSPHARIEYEHDFEGQTTATVAYADLLNSTSYGITTNAIDRNAWVGGVGVDFNFAHGLRLGIDYEALRAVGAENSQMIRFKLSEDLDGGLLPDFSLAPWSGRGLGLRADASYTFDDNVTRNDGADKLSDQSYSLRLVRPFLVPLGDNLRAIVTPFVGGEKFVDYGGLNHSVYGANGELQYRGAGDFDSPIYALFLHANGEDYNSYERTGYRYSVGLSVNKPLTDRISLFGALAYDDRHANSSVFDDQDGSARLNLDYALGSRATVYLSGEYRRGDVVSVGQGDLGDFNIASVIVRDDAFSDSSITRFAYRFRADTYLLGLGYNYALGERDSLDLSWRWAQSTPLHQPNYANAAFIRYFDNQLTVVYLVRF